MKHCNKMGRNPNLELKREVWRRCEESGFWNIKPLEVSKELGTAHQNISRWKMQYIMKHGIPDMKKLGRQLNLTCQFALRQIMEQMNNTDVRIRLRAIETFFSSLEKYTKFLEGFGFKEEQEMETQRPTEIRIIKEEI